MPAQPLTQSRSVLLPYQVVGTYDSDGKGKLVTHVAISMERQEVKCGDTAKVHHMSPPLFAGPITTQGARVGRPECPVHLVGWVSLSSDDTEGIQTWLAEMDKQPWPRRPREQYTASSSVDFLVDKTSGRRRYLRFSCVGFVGACYSEGAGIDLLAKDEQMPEVRLEDLISMYDLGADGQARRDIGLSKDGSLRIAMPGYVFHSLARDEQAIRSLPYLPVCASRMAFPCRADES